ncbi:dehydrodolichyl diphosphate synthase complex subunit NUS1 isoform X2 [Capsicum annuum]
MWITALLLYQFFNFKFQTPFSLIYQMDLGNEVQKILSWTSVCGNLALHLIWLIVHLIINVWYSALGIARVVENTLISSGLLKSYNAINITKVRYLAVVIDSEEARQTSKVLELLRWLASIGIKSICLYDREGVLKKSQTAIIEGLNKSQKATASKIKSQEAIVEGSNHGTLVEHVDLEFVSFADSKPAVAKAANLLFAKHYASTILEKPNFTESDISEALQAVGYGGPEPDLLLVYGPVRCHLGFPAWRIRYTEIVHIGPLKSMKFGSLIKAIHKFTKVHQNYGQ